MKILVIGGGGREHAIIRALKRNPKATDIYALPGNGGIAADAVCVPVAATDIEGAVDFAREIKADFAVVTPDDPLCLGMADALEHIGVPTFGPSKAAAQIEGSKVFAKGLMKKYDIPTAAYEVFDDFDAAMAYIESAPIPVVVKADGLALGKGVTVAMSREEAREAVRAAMCDRVFGESGARLVIEEYLEGPEVSVLSFTDGVTLVPMLASMDHKRALDGDEGPNTGGMGAYSPVPQIGQDVVDAAIETIVRPTVEAMAAEGTPFTGILYAGLIATADGPKVIEFNARFGDPETEVVLPKLTSDLAAGVDAILNGGVPEFTWDEHHATLGVVLAADGYPNNVIKGAAIPQIPVDESSHVYYAGVSSTEHGGLMASSGRVLLVETTADDLKAAQDKVYAIIDKLDTSGMFYRHDIGAKALKA